MNSLAVALRALDPKTFELLVCCLLKARYPASQIQHIDGASGDQGLDIISGNLDDSPTIWQCKAFQQGVGNSQKQQIRASLTTALRHYTPRRWVLCMNTDFDAGTIRWWQRFVVSNQDKTELELWQGSDILEQLLYKNTIREQFFPAITMNVPAIRAALSGSDSLNLEGLAELNEQNTNAYLARLEERDSRFSYSITHGRNQEPNSRTSRAMATVTHGNATIQVHPRDLEALKNRPPQISFTLQGAGVAKFLEYHKTGKPVTFNPEELTGVTSDFDFLVPAQTAGRILHLGAANPPAPIPMRVIFGKDANADTYEYVLFQRTSVGSEQITLESTTRLPFSLTLVLHLPRMQGEQLRGTVQFQDQSNGFSVQEVRRTVTAIVGAMSTGQIEFYDLSSGSKFLRAKLTGQVPSELKEYESFLNELCLIEQAYHIALSIPDEITPSDDKAFLILRTLTAGLAANLESISVTLEKSSATVDLALPSAAGANFRIDLPEYPEGLLLFGKRILTGPLRCEIPQGTIVNLDDYHQFLKVAPIGSLITLTVLSNGGATFVR